MTIAIDVDSCSPQSVPTHRASVAMERTAWQQPVDAGAISDRGKLQAAEEKSKDLLEAIRKRGCREQFMPNAQLLGEGQVCDASSLHSVNLDMAFHLIFYTS